MLVNTIDLTCIYGSHYNAMKLICTYCTFAKSDPKVEVLPS